MKTTRRHLALAAILGISTMALAGNGSPLSTTVVGHMCVTLLTPAAVTQSRALEFNSVEVSKNSAASFDSKKGAIRIVGNNSEYAVTVSNSSLAMSHNGKSLSIEAITATSELDENGYSSILLDGNLKVADAVAMNTSTRTPLTVTINYN